MYLPQFHRVKENDEWWGEGFTEWTAVKAAEKYCEEQDQPRKPKSNCYYDLMDKSIMQWQADLAKKYEIGGFCFYHYYFGDRQILEKPAENLLGWKDIDMPFCFCWANGSWARTWSNIAGANSWACKFENVDNREKNILLEQKYGEKRDWRKHLSYLQEFFSDNRYLKKDGRPLFMIYETDRIPCLEEMISYWKNESISQGYPEPYIIGVNSVKQRSCLDAVVLHGPIAYYTNRINNQEVEKEIIDGIETFDYLKVCENAGFSKKLSWTKTFWGAFVDYDDTPRRGKKGWFFRNKSIAAFKKQIEDLAVKNLANDNEFLFINAWNEWGEGNYLEPDETNGYAYLKTVRDVMKTVNDENFDLYRAYFPIYKKMKENECSKLSDELRKATEELNKFRALHQIESCWIEFHSKGVTLSNLLLEKQWKKIVIYGLAAMGINLYNEIKDSGIDIVAGIDRRSDINIEGLNIISPDADIPKCDAVIVTAVSGYDDIKAMLCNRNKDILVVSFSELIMEG